jgi:hypothetical protein
VDDGVSSSSAAFCAYLDSFWLVNPALFAPEHPISLQHQLDVHRNAIAIDGT